MLVVLSTQFSRAAHHPHCYSRSYSSENGTSELDSFTSTDEKEARGVYVTQLEECANNTHLIPSLLALQRQK